MPLIGPNSFVLDGVICQFDDVSELCPPPFGLEWLRNADNNHVYGARLDRHVLKDFFEGELWDESEPINDNVIYIALDPNGGANASNASGSETALVGFFMSRGRLVVSCCFVLCAFYFVAVCCVCCAAFQCASRAISIGMYGGSCAM